MNKQEQKIENIKRDTEKVKRNTEVDCLYGTIANEDWWGSLDNEQLQYAISMMKQAFYIWYTRLGITIKFEHSIPEFRK